LNGQDGLQFGFEKAPVAGFGAGMQVMVGHGGAFLRICRSNLSSPDMVRQSIIFARAIERDGYAPQGRV
jgi:hypothetical protein